MLVSFKWQKQLLICGFFYVWYLQLSSVVLCSWIHDVSQKARDHLIGKLLERVGGTPSLELITQPSLIIIDTEKQEMQFFANITWSHDRWVTRLDSCGQLNLSCALLKLVGGHWPSEGGDKAFFNTIWSHYQWVTWLGGWHTLTLNQNS